MRSLIFWVILVWIYMINAVSDPYATLGISRSASQKEIKRAYKRLAMEWHPDKNDSPEATDKFMEISQAYEVLSDPTRKERYDRFGAFDEPRQSQHGHHFHSHFEDLFNFAFGGSENGGKASFFENHRINFRMYTNSLLDKSYTKPFIIFAYSPYCHFCFRLEGIWKEAVTDLESLGYGIGTVNAMMDGNLLEKFRVNQLPALMVLVEGRVIHFRGDFRGLTAKAIRVFARNVIPSTFMQKLNDFNGMRRFLDLWQSTNKVSIIFLGTQEEPRLRYLLTAMSNSQLARFAYVNMAMLNSDIVSLKEALDIKCTKCESILIFNEFPEKGPIAKMTQPEGQLTTEHISGLLEKHKFLMLPRLSSMHVFDELCPVSSRTQRYLCVILPVADSATGAKYVNVLRKFVQQEGNRMVQDRIRITYIYINQQEKFMEEFGKNFDNDDHKRSVLVLWRNEYVMAKYIWLQNLISIDEDVLHKTFDKLREDLYLIQRGTIRLENSAKLVNLVDEYGASWFTRLSRRAVRMAETMWFHVTKEEALPVLSVIGTFVFILFIGYVLNFLMVEDRHKKVAPERPSEFKEQKEWHPEDPKIAPQRNPSMKSTSSTKSIRIWREMESMIHELRAETQFGLIRLLKPGCRSIIILVDNESKDTLLHQFALHIWPLRNNKTFSFGYLNVNKNLVWFRTLLEHTLPVDSENPTANSQVAQAMFERLKCINPKQTLGTVLVLCGWKLYFCMYHPMHKASKKNFVGFDDDESSSDSDDKFKESKEKSLKRELNLDNVLNGLSNFLDRLLEGSIRRYYIPEWPDNLK